MHEEALFAAALEKTPGAERDAFLEGACDGDLGARRRLERLLAAHEASAGILELPIRPPAGGEADAAALAPGGRIAGRYTLIEPIGEGGMGTVWVAEQTQPVRRKVALKLIKAGMDSKTVLARFEAERQALALMDHPNIAKVLDGGATDDGRPFFVMEYVKGVPLTQYCDDARLTVAQRLALFAPVCQAVQHAHTKGVVHRDLKPSNILVCLYDGRPVPKVIDFGLAKAMNQPLTEQTFHTRHGAMVGTPRYASPEQAEFNNLDVDARTDVYSLGVVLYELLTGTTPIERRRFQEASWPEVVRLIKEEEPPKPSSRLGASDSLPSLAAQRCVEPPRLARLIRGELDWIVMKCLEKDRARRYETADGLARDVQRFLADEPVEASPPSASYRLKKLLRRHRGPVLAAATIFLLLVAGVVGTTVGLVRADRALKAEAERAEGERQAKTTAEKRLAQIEKAIDVLAAVFTDLDPMAEEKEARPLRAILGERVDQAAVHLEGEGVGDALVTAKLQDRLGRTYLGLGLAAKADAMLTKALAAREALLPPDHPDTLETRRKRALALRAAGKPAEALDLLETVRKAQNGILGGDHPDTLATEHDVAVGYWLADRVDEAVALLEQVRDGRARTLGEDHADTLNTLNSLAGAYVAAQKGTEAIALFERVRNARVKLHGEDHPLVLTSMHNLAKAYQAVGKMSRALALFEQVRDSCASRLGVSHPFTLSTLDNLAWMYRALGRTSEAVALGEQVRAARMANLGPYHPQTIHTLDNLALAYTAAKEPDKALPLFLQATAGLEKLDFVHADADRIIANLSNALGELNRDDEADAWRRKWLAAARKHDGPDSVAFARKLARVASALFRKGRCADAEPPLREALAILQSSRPEAWSTHRTRALLGAVLTKLKRYDEAEPLLLQSHGRMRAQEAEAQPMERHQLDEASEWIDELYTAWGRDDKAAAWRKKKAEPKLAPKHGTRP
ncbi:MAG: serine/threonine-protein kinase [Paludisphaera borealis]|uniref:serine/threonine-protein kinase n=1 Tax=Paludisphaera borealis TaxID=1387353 RepID=UPI00284BFE37|nr:serine/threonine-protein kinase [Paludisphaera borealis]MDR3618311.1 serine/threonine-protein kinase [Paludisphaera borealis]